MTEPRQTCKLCGRSVVVTRTPNAFPPDVARWRLQRACRTHGCPCLPEYRAGVMAP